ncbi:MAG: transposase family protein [Anaerolineales bacterium]|nr:transposase family protein [Anaerolineales bacterium]
MQYSMGKLERELDAQDMEFDRGSVYDRLRQLTDVWKAKGKRYRLETVLMIVLLAKLCGCDAESIAGYLADPPGFER